MMHAYIGINVNFADTDSASVDPVVTCEQAMEESASVSDWAVEAENTVSVSDISSDAPVEDDCQKTVQSGLTEKAHDVARLPTSVKNESLVSDKSPNAAAEAKDSVTTPADSVAATADLDEIEFTSELGTDELRQLPDYFGTDMEDLPVLRGDAELPPLREADDNNIVVLYDIEDHREHPHRAPDPSPCRPTKRRHASWIRDYVRMPYVADNWQRISAVLEKISDPIESPNVVVDAIKQYSDDPETVDFSWLEDYFHEKDTAAGCDGLLSRTCLLDLIPKIAKLTVALPTVCTRPIRLLRRQKNFTVAMSQYQAACLLANAFFCTYPPVDGYELRR